LIVVSYDILDDRRRRRLAQALKDWGDRVQLSVFECLLEADDLEKLRARILTLIDLDEDNVRIYALCATCRDKVTVHGKACLTDDPEVYVL
jgi:CRISPR-associated protein Cas2